MKILNLYAGIGGNRKKWIGHEVTAIELNPRIAEIYQDYFPNDNVIIRNAHQYLLEHFKEYDFIWSSPPCQTHSKWAKLNHFRNDKIPKYPDMQLWQEIIFLQTHSLKNQFWIVENVKPYYLNKYIIQGFKKIDRYLFWSNFNITNFHLPKRKNLDRITKNQLAEWLGMPLIKKFIKNNSNELRQIYRNCVHPDLGLHILNCALNKIEDEKIKQSSLFDNNNQFANVKKNE